MLSSQPSGNGLCNLMKHFPIACVALLLVACGAGGGGGGSPSSSSIPTTTPTQTSTSCITAQINGCTYSNSDPTQSDTGWWSGTSTYNGTARTAHYIATDTGSFQLYIGDGFSAGYLTGTSSRSGSVLTLLSTSGTDTPGTVALTTALGGAGGVVTQKILTYTQPRYSTASTEFMTLNLTYNTAGDQPLSTYVGNYIKGGSNLTIASNGQMTANYPAPTFIAFNPTQMCTLTTTVAPTTLIKNVILSGIDSCGQVAFLRLYYYSQSMVLRLTVLDSSSPKAVVF